MKKLLIGLLGVLALGISWGQGATGSALGGKAYFLPQSEGANAWDWIRDFVRGGWKTGKLESLEQSNFYLYISSFNVPPCQSSVMRDCFMLPRNRAHEPYMVLCQGTVQAPENGYFRFVGMGDETFLVNFGGQNVLEAGFVLPTDKRNSAQAPKIKSMFRSLKRTKMKVPGARTWNEEAGGLYCGSVFQVEKGKRYAIRVLYSDTGARGGLCLLMQRYGEKKPTSSAALKLPEGEKLDLFRTAARKAPGTEEMARLCRTTPQEIQPDMLEFREDSLVWPSCLDAPDAALDSRFMSIPADGKTDAVEVEDDASGDEAAPEKEKPAKQKKRKKRA